MQDGVRINEKSVSKRYVREKWLGVAVMIREERGKQYRVLPSTFHLAFIIRLRKSLNL